MAAISRMQFLRGKFQGAPAAVRPPWAMPEDVFTAACRRCDACLPVCPTGILKRGSAGFPEVDFHRGECTFCGACVAACPTPALDHSAQFAGHMPWSLAARVEERCLALNRIVCRSCGEVCEAGAITFRLAPGGISHPKLDAERCNGCGACASVCPAGALAIAPSAPVAQAA